jgi:biotin carboxyl carrier protein
MAKKFRVKVNGKEYIVEVEEIKEKKTGDVKIPKVEEVRAEPVISETPQQPVVEETHESSPSGDKVIKAPMGGTVMKVNIKVGDEVNPGDTLLVFEAMKMENELKSPYKGNVKQINVKEGDMMETGQVIVVLEYTSPRG